MLYTFVDLQCKIRIFGNWDMSIYFSIWHLNAAHIFQQITANVSKYIGWYRMNTSGTIVVEIRGNISSFIMASIRPVFTISLSSDEALLVKMYSMYICQYPVLAVKGWIHLPLDKMVTRQSFQMLFVNEKFCIWIEISFKFVLEVLINNNPALV